MNDCVEEVAVDTHPDYRNRGYGKSVVSQMTNAILDIGIAPIYRTGTSSVASRRLAVGCGYTEFAESIVLRLN
jgi:predicted GNAT family acetyltransferase